VYFETFLNETSGLNETIIVNFDVETAMYDYSEITLVPQINDEDE
jgi:hypothetical protein